MLDDDNTYDAAEALVNLGCLVFLLICVIGITIGYQIGKKKYEPAAIEQAAEKAQTLEECYGVAHGLNVNPEVVCSTLTEP